MMMMMMMMMMFSTQAVLVAATRLTLCATRYCLSKEPHAE
jgi:hypothetical protein